MAKIKKIHKLKDYPNDLEKMFDLFVDILTGMEIKGSSYPGAIGAGSVNVIAEIGPRENLSTQFLYLSYKFGISFGVENSILNLYYSAGPKAKMSRILMILKAYLINSVNKAAKKLKI